MSDAVDPSGASPSAPSAGDAAGEAGDGAVVVSALWCYPVKSCRGIALAEAQVGPRGILHDREWMLVDEDDRFLSQREVPTMARVVTTLAAGALTLDSDGLPPLRLPLAAPSPRVARPRRRVEVWGDAASAIDEGDEAAAWLAVAIGVRCRLVRMAPEEVRVAKRPGFEVGFADAYSFLVVGEASLAELNARLATTPAPPAPGPPGAPDPPLPSGEPAPVAMQRFRPSVVVRGAAPFAEDDWAELHLGEVTLVGTTRCARCAIVDVDPATGARATGPLATLGRYRLPRPGEDPGVYFGRNFNHRGSGRIRVGTPARPR